MTGMWTSEPPEEQAPAMPLSAHLLRMRENQASPLEMALARARADEARAEREAAASARDPDDVAAELIGRGYAPGMMFELSQRLAETEALLADEEGKLEKAAQRSQRTREMHERGQIDISGVIARWRDTDDGDPGAVARLTRRRDSLRQQVREASELMAPQRAPEDPMGSVNGVARAARAAAHEAFAEATRAKLADAAAGRPVRREPRPFGLASRGGVAVRSEQCVYCIADGVDPETSFLLHSDPELNVPVTRPVAAGGAVTYLPYETDGPTVGEPVVFPGAEAGRGESWPVRYDASGREITRGAGCSDVSEPGSYQPVAGQ